MFERRPLVGLLILLTICLSIWRISLQETSLITDELEYHPTQYQIQESIRRQFLRSSPINEENQSIKFISRTTSEGNIRNSNVKKFLDDYNHLSTPSNNSRFSNYFNLSLPLTSITSINPDILPNYDLNRLINLNNFNFLMNQKSCKNSHKNNYNRKINENGDQFNSPLLLILIHSAPDNHMKRLLIRETWGSYKSPFFRLIFLLGAVNSTKIQHRLELENKMFSDIVQGNFIDDYRNMTYKHVMALKWFTYYCSNVKFILKIDDDVFVNTPFLLDFLNRNAPPRNLLFCDKQLYSRVKRSYRSKWHVSTKEYSGRYYPPYCPGYAILYSPDVAFRLYQKSQEIPYFWIDDVHITGTVAQQANITITSFISFVLDKGSYNYVMSGKTDKNNFLFLFTWPDITEEQARNLWKLIENLR